MSTPLFTPLPTPPQQRTFGRSVHITPILGNSQLLHNWNIVSQNLKAAEGKRDGLGNLAIKCKRKGLVSQMQFHFI